MLWSNWRLGYEAEALGKTDDVKGKQHFVSAGFLPAVVPHSPLVGNDVRPALVPPVNCDERLAAVPSEGIECDEEPFGFGNLGFDNEPLGSAAAAAMAWDEEDIFVFW